ncbi:helix-turn-helix transcriptional regulator [Candidatus Peregrinibacteria bacterium]|jgi:transcriptional regulator with XRE-family HTH domain|nr:helix-turn-helix transcriptional regulator [Candidatus Peregrinibacteria bacterium]
MKSKTFHLNHLTDYLWEAAKESNDPKAYSQAGLARKINVSRESVSCWAQNKHQPCNRNRKKILKYLNEALPELEMKELFYSETLSINL